LILINNLKANNKMRGEASVICCFVLCNYLLSSSRATEIDLGSERRALRSKLSTILEIQSQQQLHVDDLIEKTLSKRKRSIND